MDRRTFLTYAPAAIALGAVTSSGAKARVADVQSDDAAFMKLALAEAAKAAFPFGAVVVKNGAVIASGYNRTGVDADPTAHGEMVAIRACLKEHGPEALKGATVYTSGEPCCMCMGALVWCGVTRVVYAASLADIAAKGDQIALSAEDVAAKSLFQPIDIVGGVLASDAAALFSKL